jgi:hypothetical protein
MPLKKEKLRNFMIEELSEGPEAFSWSQNVLYRGLRGHL